LIPDLQVFFDVLLPPIILWAGFSMKKKEFLENFSTLVSGWVGGWRWGAGSGGSGRS
jgi:NhaP-type Na+/H+ or K+/H+ antiporter